MIHAIIHYRDGLVVARAASEKRVARATEQVVSQMLAQGSDRVEIRDGFGKIVFEFPPA